MLIYLLGMCGAVLSVGDYNIMGLCGQCDDDSCEITEGGSQLHCNCTTYEVLCEDKTCTYYPNIHVADDKKIIKTCSFLTTNITPASHTTSLTATALSSTKSTTKLLTISLSSTVTVLSSTESTTTDELATSSLTIILSTAIPTTAVIILLSVILISTITCIMLGRRRKLHHDMPTDSNTTDNDIDINTSYTTSKYIHV